MATTTNVQQWIESALETVGLMLGDLGEVADEWDELSEGERAGWSLDWDNEMAKLEHLAELAGAGLLTPEQLARYRALATRLKAVQAHVERTGLYAPRFLSAHSTARPQTAGT